MVSSKHPTLKKVGRKGAQAATGVARTLTDPKKTKRLIVVGHLLVPLIAPIALQAVNTARTFADQQRARALGVDIDDVAAYRGPTGRTRARIDAVSAALTSLRDRRTGDPDVVAFVEGSASKLVDLTSATNAAAPMPPSRRRPTLAAVGLELDQIESSLVKFLVRAER